MSKRIFRVTVGDEQTIATWGVYLEAISFEVARSQKSRVQAENTSSRPVGQYDEPPTEMGHRLRSHRQRSRPPFKNVLKGRAIK